MKYIRWFFAMSVILLLSAGCNNQSSQVADNAHVKKLDLSQNSAEKPKKKFNLLFIHHSCGATLMAEEGDKTGEYCLWSFHPNGGGLRSLLVKNNYSVHEATYGSKIGQDTDINHWRLKFRDYMDIILKTDHQNKLYESDSANNIILFKSCYPNNRIIADGTFPGDPDSNVKTLKNFKAAYNGLLPYFRQQPKTLFVAMTAPPLVKPQMNPLKEFLLNLVAKGPKQVGRRARMFNNWLKDIESGWLSNYNLKNVVVFDYYDILTGEGYSNWTKYPTKEGRDSHPSSEGNEIAARKFILFLNRAVRYAGLSL